MVEIIKDYPPNYSEIVQAFPQVLKQRVIFAYAPYIYAPHSTEIAPELIAHEKVHIARQMDGGVQEWWYLYIEDPEFRYEEELLAHVEEYKTVLASTQNRNIRRSALKIIAKKLSAPLYGRMMTPEKALKDILAMVEDKSDG